MSPWVVLVLGGLAAWLVLGAGLALLAGRLLARRDAPEILALERANAGVRVRSYAA